MVHDMSTNVTLLLYTGALTWNQSLGGEHQTKGEKGRKLGGSLQRSIHHT